MNGRALLVVGALTLVAGAGCRDANAQGTAKVPPSGAQPAKGPAKTPPGLAKGAPTQFPGKGMPVSAKAPPSPAEKARLDRRVAKVGDAVITVQEVEERIAKQSPFLRGKYADPAQRMEFLESLIRFELLARAAKKRGYNRDDEVQRQTKQQMVQALTRREFDTISAESITDAEIRAYFDSHADEFNKPEMVRASHILLADERRARDVLKQVQDASADNRAFRRLVQEHSEDDATKSRGGDLRYFPRSGAREEGDPAVPAEVAAAAFAIKNVGDVAPRLIKSAKGFHIVKLAGRREPLHRTLAEVGPQIRNRLWREKRAKSVEDFIAQLRKSRPVEINEELLSLVKVNPPRGHESMRAPGDPISPEMPAPPPE